MDIDTMPAGPEMDALIAVEVMGWEPGRVPTYWRRPNRAKGQRFRRSKATFLPSTNIAHAMEAAGKRRFIFWNLEDGRVCATFDIDPADYISQHTIDVGLPSGVGVADTLPLAICRAALNAVRKNAITYRGASITPDKMTGANGP